MARLSKDPEGDDVRPEGKIIQLVRAEVAMLFV